MVMPSKFGQDPNCEISKAQLLLLDKLNLQSIIDNKNMAHAITALDLLRMDGVQIGDHQIPPLSSTDEENTTHYGGGN